MKPKPLPSNFREWLENIVAFRWGDGSLSRRDARVLLAGYVHLEQRVEQLKRAGAPMANTCYNLAQLSQHQLTDRQRESMTTMCRDWDEAMKPPHSAVRKRASTRRSR